MSNIWIDKFLRARIILSYCIASVCAEVDQTAIKHLDFKIQFVVLLRYPYVCVCVSYFCKFSFQLGQQKLFQLINKNNLLKSHTISSTGHVSDHDDTYKLDKVTCQNRLLLSVLFQTSFSLSVYIARITLSDHVMHLSKI